MWEYSYFWKHPNEHDDFSHPVNRQLAWLEMMTDNFMVNLPSSDVKDYRRVRWSRVDRHVQTCWVWNMRVEYRENIIMSRECFEKHHPSSERIESGYTNHLKQWAVQRGHVSVCYGRYRNVFPKSVCETRTLWTNLSCELAQVGCSKVIALSIPCTDNS